MTAPDDSVPSFAFTVTMEKLVDIFLDGFASGITSLAVSSGTPQDIAAEAAKFNVATISGDPGCMETVRGGVLARLRGESFHGRTNVYTSDGPL